MKITFVITFAYESLEQLEWCISHLRKSYHEANVILISDGHRDPMYLPEKYNTIFIAGQKLKIISCGALWWKRFFTEALKTNADIIFKIDPDTKIWRRLNYLPSSDFFGMLEGTAYIQGGCQGFNRKFAEKIIESKITEEENYKNQDFWGNPDFKACNPDPNYFSTDWSMIHMAKRLNATLEKHPEIYSRWVPFDFLRKAPANWTMQQFAEDYQIPKESEFWKIFVDENNQDLKYAITHPHKLNDTI